MQTASLKGAHLSLQQMRLWPFQQNSRAYRAQCAIRVEGELNVAILLRALQEVIRQHEILRTGFYSLPGMDVPMQIISDDCKLFYATINLEGLCDAEQIAQLDTCFDLLPGKLDSSGRGAIISALLAQMSAHVHVLLLCLPALCADTATLKQLVAEIHRTYIAYRRGENLDADPLQYVDVSAWQNKLLEEDSSDQQAFWHKIDLSLLSTAPFPFERKGTETKKRLEASKAFEPQRLVLPISAALQNQLLACSQESRVSPEVFLLACWQLLIWRLNDVSPYPVGVACDGRSYEELATAIGLYSRVVPFAVPLTDNLPFTHLLSLVDASLKETLQQQMSFTWERSVLSNSSLGILPVGFEFESWPATFSDGELSFSLLQRYCCSEPFALKLSALQQGETLQLELYFDPDRLPLTHANYLADLLLTLLHSASAQPRAPIGTLQILNHTEQQRLQRAFTGRQKTVPFRALQQSFETQADLRAGQLAVVCGHEALTYQQLNTRANQLAHFLRRKGVGPNVLVGLCMERSVDMLVGLLGILKAGGAYVPLDPEQPATRLIYQLHDLSASPLLLTQERLLSRFEGWEGATFCLDNDQGLLEQELTSNPDGLNASQDLAYVIFTSGSTGTPKGVMVPHGAVSNYTQSLCELLAPEPAWQFATVSTLSADLGNTAIFCALASGGCLHILPYAIATSSRAFADYLNLHPIDVLKIVPSHLSALLNSGPGKALLPRRYLVLGGEALPRTLLTSLYESGCSCSIINHYGPTETTVGALVNVLGVLQASEGTDEEEHEGSIPIGRPIANTEAYILDRNRQVVPQGVIGELCLAGAGLAIGYLKLPEQTAERFAVHPFRDTGERIYRTGDLARYREDGMIEFVGRQDNQIKIRGFRVELGEVEAVLNEHSSVRENAVVLRRDKVGESQLVAYIVAKQPRPTSGELRGFLESRLPRHMLPSSFAFVRSLPLNANGKVNRQLLSCAQGQEEQTLLSLLDQNESKIPVQPRDEIEFQLLQIWEKLLNVSPISILDNFFDLGGHSILAVRLMSLIHKHFGEELALTTLFNAPTIEKLALLLRHQATPSGGDSVVVKLAEGTNTPFFCVHPAGSYVFCYTDLARCLGPDQPFYGLQTPLSREPYDNLEDMAAHYVAAIQTVQPQGPYLLGGWSLGGVVAFEMALQLRKRGQEVALLAIIDSDAPVLNNPHPPLDKPEVDDKALAKDVLSVFELPTPGDDFHLLEPEKQLEYACEQAKIAHAIPADVDLDLLRRIIVMRKMNIYAARRYEPQVYPGRITLFRATESIRAAQSEEATSDADITRGWEKLSTMEIEMHLVSGKHRQLVEEPVVQVLAASLRQYIMEAGNKMREIPTY